MRSIVIMMVRCRPRSSLVDMACSHCFFITRSTWSPGHLIHVVCNPSETWNRRTIATETREPGVGESEREENKCEHFLFSMLSDPINAMEIWKRRHSFVYAVPTVPRNRHTQIKPNSISYELKWIAAVRRICSSSSLSHSGPYVVLEMNYIQNSM